MLTFFFMLFLVLRFFFVQNFLASLIGGTTISNSSLIFA
jgi:hypothetical protein